MRAPDGLNDDDPGLRLLADAVARVAPDQVLLALCGDPPGMRGGATRLTLDVREHTGSVHRCVPVGLDGDPLSGREFAAALCWPRAHLGLDFSRFSLAYGAQHLELGGVLWCAARKQKGGKRLAQTMEALLGNVETRARDHGYHLYASRRGAAMDEALARELIDRRYEIRDPRLGELSLCSAPGVFSRRQLDTGTGVLLEHTSERIPGPIARAVDLGCGVGALGLWAADRWPDAHVLAVDSNVRAVALAQHNAARLGLSSRVSVAAADGLDELPASLTTSFSGNTDLFLVNPPTHADAVGLASFLRPVGSWLSAHGCALVVVNRPGRATQALEAAGLTVRGFERGAYHVLEARR